MAGLPGSGKSALAQRISKLFKFALLDLDHLKHSSIDDPYQQGWIAYDTLFKLVECQLSNRINLIVDTCLTYHWLQKKFFDYAQKYEAIPIVLLCQCSDQIAKDRILSRLSRGEQLDCTLEKYERLKKAFELSNSIPDLVIDTGLPLSLCSEQVIGFLNSVSLSLSEIGYASFLENVVNKKILEIRSLIEEERYISHQSSDQSLLTQNHFCESFKIEVSNGEIIDRFTILSIKLERIKNPAKLSKIRREYFTLIEIVGYIKSNFSSIVKLADELLEINTTLWDVENRIRYKESCQEFDKKFIELARSIYCLNDKRSDIKFRINIVTNSQLIEQKQYLN